MANIGPIYQQSDISVDSYIQWRDEPQRARQQSNAYDKLISCTLYTTVFDLTLPFLYRSSFRPNSYKTGMNKKYKHTYTSASMGGRKESTSMCAYVKHVRAHTHTPHKQVHPPTQDHNSLSKCLLW